MYTKKSQRVEIRAFREFWWYHYKKPEIRNEFQAFSLSFSSYILSTSFLHPSIY